MTISATMTVPCACDTDSMVWPTTTYWLPAGAPSMRTDAFPIGIVTGSRTS